MKELVVEDEEKIQAFVRKGLEARRFSVVEAENGDDGFAPASTGEHNVILLPGRGKGGKKK